VSRARIAGITSWYQVALEGEAREKVKRSFEAMLGGLAKLFERSGRPFLLGEKTSYADCIIGGGLRMYQVCLKSGEWEKLKGWHGGVFGRLADALEQFSEVK